ncbi:protein YIF1B isoform X4 [Rhodamnia argentea]|uniref:Protein YIF1B isoform X4 n=1 Tax=Rhodamnia argentea TaxID=178133 RepID=A0A8B8NZ48_9MYRT|nr:protein YIF1B isoform X4 [Rhodamnia argentea]
MYENPRMQPGAPRPLTQSQPNPFEGAFYGAGSGLIRGDLGTYGEKFLGSSSEYVQSNCHWTRITEPVGGRLSYRPPIYDINAPDLYIPFMAFGTYVILAGLLLGLQGRFSPDAVQWLFVKGLLGWSLQVMLLKVTLLSLGGVEPPLLDIVAYAGYTFAGLCLAIMGKIILSYMYFVMMPLACLCMGIFLVKTMKRVLSAEVRSYDSSRLHYLLLFIAFAQFPLFSWLGNISLNWLF